ncbi:DUF803 domain membrane protein, partial [Aspergillus ruber CBS 135680]
QEPLAAGLLAGFVSTIVPSSVSSNQTLSGGHGSGPGRMHEWSSLIGISTALVGNVLISLALNIQRYAHIRIDKEWTHDRIQQESDWKRTRPGRDAAGANGNAGEYHDEPRGRHHEPIFEPYRDESPDPQHARDGNSRARDQQGEQSASHGGLQESTFSDQTVRPEDKVHRKSYLRSPYWWVGIVLMVLGETGNFMAYGFAPASIVSPLGVVALISNCVIAPFMLKEQFRKRDLLGVLVSIAGAVVVVISAKSSEEKIGPHDIWKMITQWEFELYLGLTAGLIVALMWMSAKHGSQTILIDVGLVALFGGYTALSTKGVSSLLSYTLWHVITFPVTYLLVFILVFSALMQIRYINRALQRFDSTQVIPTQFVLFTLSVIIGSAILYRDFESFGAQRAGKFVGGCLMTFLGVYFITSGRVRADDESTYSVDDEEQAIGLLGERYHDNVDVTPPGPESRVHKPLQRVPEALDEEPPSPRGSLLSQGIDGFEDDHPTPRGFLSTAPSFEGSLTAESLRAPSPEPPHSLITNPWADSQERLVDSPASEPQIRPVTPPEQTPDQNMGSTVLLRFPPAPGAESNAPQNDDVGALETHPAQPAAPETPTARRMRNSISMRFSPGPLLPALSGGFSAVVAESLRRGESSPVKERKGRRRTDRRKQLSTTVLDGALRRTDEAREAEYDSDGAVEENQDSPFKVSTGRLNSTGGIPTGLSIPRPPQGINHGSQNNNEDVSNLNRLRSLSDSWSGGPAWLGGLLRRGSKQHQQPPINESAVQGDESE